MRKLLFISFVLSAPLFISGSANAQCTGIGPAHTVCAAPSGGTGFFSPRALVAGDIPTGIPWGNITGTPTTLAGYGITSPLPYAQGGCNAITQTACTNNIFPTPSQAGDVAYWNGTTWVTLPGNNTGTKVLQETSTGVPSWATVAGSGTVTSVATAGLATGGAITSTGTITVTAAVKSDQTTASSNAVAVTPGVQQFHPSAVKAWAYFTQSGGTYTNAASYNVASFVKNTTGDVTITWTTAFSSVNYACNVTTSSTSVVGAAITPHTAATLEVILATASAGISTDVNFNISCEGAQ